MDCHGAGGDCSFNSLIPDALDPRCEFVVQTRWTEYTGDARAGLRRRPVRRPAREGRRRARRALAHRVSSTNWHDAALQRRRSSARSASTPRCAAPGARPSRSSPATTSSARSRRRCSAPGCRRSRSRPGSAASAPATSPPPAPASEIEHAARAAAARPAGRAGLRPRRALHDRRRARHPRPRRPLPQPGRRRRSRARARSRRPRPRGGTPGARSISDAQQNVTLSRGRTRRRSRLISATRHRAAVGRPSGASTISVQVLCGQRRTSCRRCSPTVWHGSRASRAPNGSRSRSAVPGGWNQNALDHAAALVACARVERRVVAEQAELDLAARRAPAISEFSVVSVVDVQPGSGSVAPSASRASRPCRRRRRPCRWRTSARAGGSVAAVVRPAPRSSATSPLGR